MKKFLLIPLLLILLLPLATAVTTYNRTEYITKGVTNNNWYSQGFGDVGVWNNNRTATTYNYAGDFQNSPVIKDVDNDGVQEIIILDDSTVQIFNYTTGKGLRLEASFNLISNSYFNTQFYQTPGLIDSDDNNITEIVVFNITHVFALEWNGTAINSSKNSTLNIDSTAGVNTFRYPVIKCNENTAHGQEECVIPIDNRTKLAFMLYIPDISYTEQSTNFATGIADDTQSNFHSADVDNNGYAEYYHRHTNGAANADFFIYKATTNSTGNITASLFYTKLDTSPAEYTDIIINNIDGALPLEISFGFSSNTDKDYELVTLDSTGAVKASNYCSTILGDCVIGDQVSINMFRCEDASYCHVPEQDVCLYSRDYGTNTDTIGCYNYAGRKIKETTVTNIVNFSTSHPILVHYSGAYAGASVTTPAFGIDGLKKQTNGFTGNDMALIPIDIQKNGLLDFIGYNNTVLHYYDDGYTNTNTQINSQDWDTGNPVCQNEIIKMSYDVTDTESDLATCYISEKYGNNTIKENITAVTATTMPTTIDLNYYADAVGTFLLEANCKDAYHTTYATRTYTIVVSSDTNTCNYKGINGGSNEYLTTTEESDDASFDAGVTSLLDTFNIKGKGKAILWLLIMIVVGYGVLKVVTGSVGVYGVALVESMMLVMGWYFGFIGTVALVIVGLVCAVVLAMMLVNNNAGGG